MKYISGDLFNAPKGSVLIHSCNCYGSWGAGIATQFYKRFPRAFNDYRETCKLGTPKDLLGHCRVVEENDYFVVSLFASSGYGKYKDTPDQILNNTEKALKYLKLMARNRQMDIHMPKINSGLFNVPWHQTERLIETILEPFHNVTVYEL